MSLSIVRSGTVVLRFIVTYSIAVGNHDTYHTVYYCVYIVSDLQDA